MFLNILSTLQRLFKKNSIVLIAGKDYANAKPNFIKCEPFVSMTDEITECNFRMIESYLPELLYLLSNGLDESKCISTLISRLANEGFPYPDVQLSHQYLRHKVICLLEAMLFADIFGKVWKGDIAANRVYVYKDDIQLSYYHHHQVRTLLCKLLDRISIKRAKTNDLGLVRAFNFHILK